jgi:type I restriction enzyme M protein
VADPDGFFAELDVLYDFLRLYDAVSTHRRAVREAQDALFAEVVAAYPTLTDAQVKALVVEDKWVAAVEDAVRGEVERVTQRLAGRVQTLEARYATPLPDLEDEADALAARVREHLETITEAHA